MRKYLAIVLLLFAQEAESQSTWVDSIDLHGREVFMPAAKYKWDWGQATFLRSLEHLYEAAPASRKQLYLDYIKTAMDTTYRIANGKHPNAVASAHGMVFLARLTKDKRWLEKCRLIEAEYYAIPRASNGGVSHRAETVELWDDTVYMLSMFLLEMYRLTGDEKYIAEFLAQFQAHHDKLLDTKSGLWVHAWDNDNEDYNDGCSVQGWADKSTRRSSQIWARGNGWIGMALSDALLLLKPTSKLRKPLTTAFLAYVKAITPWQQPSGQWMQLITLPDNPKNFEESSCTAMFAYTITMGLRMKLLDPKVYGPMADKAYAGLRKLSMRADAGGAYLVPARVSGGTCVGDESYYLNRKITEGTGFGYGTFIMFGLAYEQYKGIRK